jgi:DUF4097 and DUF4098 domain-containing protein YvlB
MKTRLLLIAVAFPACTALYAQAPVPSFTENIKQEMSIAPLGSFWIDNPLGTIEITGGDIERISVSAIKTVYAPERTLLDEARSNCVLSFEGDDKVRLVRTIARAPFSRCVVSYTVQIPRSTDVKIAGQNGDVRVTNVNGGVTLRSFMSNVHFSGVTGATAVDITRGHILYELPKSPISNVQMTVVAGDIDVYVPGDANFEWIANTLAGDMLSTMTPRGSIVDGTFHGHFNSPGGPTINTQSVLGRVRVLSRGTTPQQSRSIRVANAADLVPRATPKVGFPTVKIQTPYVGGNFVFPHPDEFADVSIGEIRGSASVETAAGSIDLQTVLGDCTVTTGGGPLNLGEISGILQAITGGGDILVRAARVGGDVRTNGGIVRMLYTGGATKIQSQGGDIVVRQVAGPLTAITPSGDITLTMDATAKSLHVEARTSKGNVSFNIPPRFAGTIDATILTSNPEVNTIHSDFPSLTIRKEQVGNKTRIRATGKINGGGEKIELYAEDGDITINAQSQAPAALIDR